MLTLTRVLSWSASPSTVTTVGVTVTLSTSKPGAGVPVMTGFTGSVRDWRSENTGSVTWTNRGERSTGLTRFPTLSTGMRSTSWSMSIPGSWITTEPIALTTLSTSDLAPSTVTCLGSTSMTPTVSPAAGPPARSRRGRPAG